MKTSTFLNLEVDQNHEIELISGFSNSEYITVQY